MPRSGRSNRETLTLSEVSRRTGISMRALRRYTREHQGRIPAVGAGRKQRFPREALKVFEALKAEGLKRRGARRKGKSAARARGDAGLLTLSEVSRQTGIPYPTLLQYAHRHLSRVPH